MKRLRNRKGGTKKPWDERNHVPKKRKGPAATPPSPGRAARTMANQTRKALRPPAQTERDWHRPRCFNRRPAPHTPFSLRHLI